MNIKGWFPLGVTGLFSLLPNTLSRVFSSSRVWKHQFYGLQPSLWSSSHIRTWLLEKNIALTMETFVRKVMSLLFHMLSKFVKTFLTRRKCLLILGLQLLSAVILESKKIMSVTVSIVSPPSCNEVMRPHAMILVFWMLSFKPAFSPSSVTFIKRLFSPSLLSAINVVSSAYLCLWIFLLATLIIASDSLSLAMMYPACKLNKQSDSIQPWHTPFPILSQSLSMSGSNCWFLTCLQISQEAGKVVRYSHLFKNFPRFVVIHS